MTFFENFKSASRPAYSVYVTTDDCAVTGWGVMDRRNPAAAIVNGLTEEQATRIADYLNQVTGAVTE